MTNHYHLLIETPEMGLSRGMKWLNQSYAQFFNERHRRVGHLFQGRFKGILVEREGHLLELIRYIVLNPVRAGIVPSAAEYSWSNYRATAGLEAAPSWLEVDWTLRQFGETSVEQGQDAYRQFVADARGVSYRPWDLVTGQIYLGGPEFCDRMQALVGSEQRSEQHPRPQREFSGPTLDDLARLVAGAFDVPVGTLHSKSKGLARKALAGVAVEHAGLTIREVAAWLEVSDWAASKMRTASNELYGSETEYRARINAVCSRLKLCF